MTKRFDLICIGRAAIDLFSQDIGADFEDITGFAALAGGTPLNIAVGGQRLGLKTAFATGISTDGVAAFLRKFLTKEGVDTEYWVAKPHHNTVAFVLGVQPPDGFPIVPYQSNAADLELTIDDLARLPLPESHSLLITGMSLQSEPSRSAVLYTAERASREGVGVYMDVDYKDYQWRSARDFGITARLALSLVDVAIGTEEEICAAAETYEIDDAAHKLLQIVRQAVVVKRGGRGATIYTHDRETIDISPYPVKVLNVYGAGDAFAAGFITGRIQGESWQRAGQIGTACGAYIVTQHGCANDMPTWEDLETVFTRTDS